MSLYVHLRSKTNSIRLWAQAAVRFTTHKPLQVTISFKMGYPNCAPPLRSTSGGGGYQQVAESVVRKVVENMCFKSPPRDLR